LKKDNKNSNYLIDHFSLDFLIEDSNNDEKKKQNHYLQQNQNQYIPVQTTKITSKHGYQKIK
jgi:hypothetical protein